MEVYLNKVDGQPLLSADDALYCINRVSPDVKSGELAGKENFWGRIKLFLLQPGATGF